MNRTAPSSPVPGTEARTVLVVDPVSSGAMYEAMLTELGLTTILLYTAGATAAGLRGIVPPHALDYDDDFGGDLDRLREYCLHSNVGYVVAGCESGIELCEALRVDLPSCPANAPADPARRWDKFEMTKALAAQNVPSLHTLRCANLAQFEAELGGLTGQSRWIVKPARGAASVDVALVDGIDGARSAVAAILDHPGLFGEEVTALVQEYYVGDEYVVDTFSHDGQHDVISACMYRKSLRDGAFVYERAVWIHPDHRHFSSLVEYSHRALDALGVRNGASHMEILLGADGPRLVDFGARPAGGGFPKMTYLLTGSSQVHAESAYVKSLCDPRDGRPYPGSGDYTIASHGAIVIFNIETAGICTAADPAADLLRIDGVVDAPVKVERGGRYPATRSLMDSLALGTAFVVAGTAEELDRVCTQVERTVAGWFAPVPVCAAELADAVA